MKKGVKVWDVLRSTPASLSGKSVGDLLGEVEARSRTDAISEAYAKFQLRTDADRKGIFVKERSY